MKKITLSLIAIALIAFTISSCKKETTETILEPITLVSPDSTTVFIKRGTTQKIDIKYTTDRPINYVQILYEVDTTGDANHVYTYPDTLFYLNFDSTGAAPSNKYNYVGAYTLPDTIKLFDKVRFKTTFKAQKLIYPKEFKIVANG